MYIDTKTIQQQEINTLIDIEIFTTVQYASAWDSC